MVHKNKEGEAAEAARQRAKASRDRLSSEERKAKQRSATAKWRKEHPKENKNNVRIYYGQNKEVIAEKARRYHLQRKFSLSVEDYDKLLALQNGVCAICKLTCSSGNSLSVDHDHKTGKIRALLCRSCNFSLGLMKEDPALMRAAADYLELYGETNGRLRRGVGSPYERCS